LSILELSPPFEPLAMLRSDATGYYHAGYGLTANITGCFMIHVGQNRTGSWPNVSG